jgi:hypothetical protein
VNSQGNCLYLKDRRNMHCKLKRTRVNVKKTEKIRMIVVQNIVVSSTSVDFLSYAAASSMRRLIRWRSRFSTR